MTNHQVRPKKTPGWVIAVIAVAAILLVCGVGAVAIAVKGTAEGGGAGDYVVTGTDSPQPASTSSAGVSSGPVTSIEDGTYEVGVEVTPGKYKSPGAKQAAFQLCTWSVKDNNGVVDLGSASGTSEQEITTLKTGQVFESSGCQTWVKVG